MPELPDVAGFRARFNKHALNRPMVRIHVAKPRLLTSTNPQGMGKRLKGQAFVETRRHGKFLLARLDTDGWLALHFGMTGDLAFYSNNEQPPENAAVSIEFRDGGHLACISRRLLGRLEWVGQVDDFVRRKQLGPDALSENLSVDGFVERFSERRGLLKSAFMNQSIIAGIGNIYSDEILFQSGFSPKTLLADLGSTRLYEIYRIMARVLRAAVNANVDGRQLPKSYLLPHRQPGGTCPRCRTGVKATKVAGRTSYYCPNCQNQ